MDKDLNMDKDIKMYMEIYMQICADIDIISDKHRMKQGILWRSTLGKWLKNNL